MRAVTVASSDFYAWKKKKRGVDSSDKLALLNATAVERVRRMDESSVPVSGSRKLNLEKM